MALTTRATTGRIDHQGGLGDRAFHRGQTEYTLDEMTATRVETLIHGEAWALGFDEGDIT